MRRAAPSSSDPAAAASGGRPDARLHRRLLWALVIATALAMSGIAAVWMPLWLHYRVVPGEVAPQVIETHRRLPDDKVLDAVAAMSMTTDHPLAGEAAVAAAKRLLAGELAWPNLPVVRMGPDFSPQDLDSGVPVQHVFAASLIVPDLMLRAHAHAPDPAYEAAALKYFRGFAEYEQQVEFPRMYERNSHATANRASVLARLWRHLRQAPGYQEETGRLVHLHAQRLAALLSKPSQFVAGTNHGVMQNIALLQLATAFPALPDAKALRTLAVQRLAMQLPGYIAGDGAVLEHSAGYQFHGVVLSGYVTRLLQLLGEPAGEWTAAHERARDFLAAVQRPDASLPQYGNTYRYAWALPAALGIDQGSWRQRLRERDSFSIVKPVSGYAVAWDASSAAGTATHTTVPWSHFHSHGHQRAQELSLMVWAAGTDWSTNTGYWPGDDPQGAQMAEGWAGGNGPHVVGETGAEDRRSVLLAQVATPGLRFLDLQRQAAPGAAAPQPQVRRQVLQWQGSTWIALDTYADAGRRPLRVLWTAAPETTQRALGQRSFRHEREGSPVAFTLSVAGSDGTTAQTLRGSRQPFGGWVAFDRRAAAAPSVDAQLPSPAGWMAAVLELHPAAAAAPSPLQASMVRYGGPEDWQLQLQRSSDNAATLEVTRNGSVLSVREGRPQPGAAATSPARALALAPAEPVDAELRAIEISRSALLAAYPRFRTLESVRLRYTKAIAAAWAVAALSIGLFAAWARQRRRGVPG